MIKTAKIFLVILLLCTGKAYSQHVYQIRADSVRIYNVCDTAELIIENRTRGVAGYLYNKGNGRTEFRRIRLETVGNNQIAITGQDTLNLSSLSGIGGVDTIYRNGDNILYVKKGVTYTINAPVVQTGSFVQNQSAAIQSANFNIGGFGAFAKNGSNAFQASLQFTNLAMSRGVNMQLNGDATPGLATWIHNGTAWAKRLEIFSNGDMTNTGSTANLSFKSGTTIDFSRNGANYIAASDVAGYLNFVTGGAVTEELNSALTLAANKNATFRGQVNITNIPAQATAATLYLTSNGGTVSSRSAAQLLADIGAAPLSGSNSYIKNDLASAQSANFYISQVGRTNGSFQIARNGSATIANAFTLANAALDRGANLQLNGDATPGLATWIHDGTNWMKRAEISADGSFQYPNILTGNSAGVTTAGTLDIGSIPALGTAAATFLTHSSGVVQTRTPAQVLSDIGGAPASSSANYIQNQSAALQTAANFWTNTGRVSNYFLVSRDGSSAVQGGFSLYNAALTRGVQLQLNGDVNPGLAMWSHNGAAWQRSFDLFASGAFAFPNILSGSGSGVTVSNIPALGTAGTTFLTHTAGLIQSRTAAQILSDIGAAPLSGSGNYIHNQNVSAQSATYRLNGAAVIQKDGSVSLVPGFLLYNAAGTRGVNFQLNSDATPGLATWIHDGTAWVKRMETDATTGAADIFAEGGEGLNLNRTVNTALGATGGVRFNALNSASAPVSYAQIWGVIGTNTAAAENGYLDFNTRSNGVLANKMRLMHDGNLLLGTTIADGSKLLVNGNIKSIGGVTSTNGTVISYLTYATGNVGIAGTATAHPFALYSSGVERMRINAGGNVLMGTTTDDALNKLQVAGNIALTGAASNQLLFNNAGIGAPTVGTRSIGTKITLYPSLTATTADYAIGIESGTIWHSAGSAVGGFKWYANTTSLAGLSSAGLVLNNIPAQATAGTLFLTSNGGLVSSRTAAQVLADLGAAPITGSGNYVHNQDDAAQTANAWISGTLRTDTRLYAPELWGVGAAGASVISNSTTGALQLIGGATGAGSARGAQINLYAGGHTTGLGAMAFYTGAGTGGTLQPERMRITPGGAVGIGTTNPLFDLHVQSATANGIAIQNTTAMAANSGAFLRMYNSGVPSAADHRLGGFLWGANTTGATYAVGAQVQAASESAWTSGTSHPTYISFQTVSSGVGLSEKLRLNSTGMVVTGNARINGGSVTVPGGNITLGGAGVTTAYNLDVTRSVSSVNYSARLTVGAAGQAVLTASNGTAASDKSIYLNFSGDPAYSPNGGTTQHTLWHAGNQPVATTGTANTLAKRDASGAVYATGFFQSSMAALKDNISDFNEPALPLINGLAIKEFTYKADKEHNIHFGIIADSSDWHFSTKDHNKFDTNSSLAITIKAMQELSKKNEALEEKVKSLEERLARLEKLLK
ncbi:tail fiber domain-containing protein [Chitinophaga sp. 22620]|uniref:tail fiber domain-containing protein n=1 Tax=Chitinophaga sp. 22620 TaxID=3453952 RepID=UPI003F835CA2